MHLYFENPQTKREIESQEGEIERERKTNPKNWPFWPKFGQKIGWPRNFREIIK